MEERASVSELELFFDLVFVYALTRVTELVEPATWGNALHAVLVLAVLWWVLVGYAWLGNVVRADHGAAKAAIFLAMGATLVLALAIPEAFTDRPGGLPGPLVFAAGYAVVRIVHVTAFWALSGGDAGLRGQLSRWIPSLLLSVALFVVASRLHGAPQAVLWATALVVDYTAAQAAGNDWRINSAGHFAERHGLIVIIALGESIVEIGAGVAGDPVTWRIIGAALLALALCALLWWAYFDMSAPLVEHALTQAVGAECIRIARGSYTFMHLPMVAGVIGLSVGLEHVLEDAAGREPLHGIPLYLMYGGTALFLAGLIGFKHMAAGSWSRPRAAAAAAVLIAVPAAAHLSAIGALALLTAILAALVGYETTHWSAVRNQVRGR
ncbi:MAG: low temperature requirement protein A [Mycobacteriaceae bacterium]|nr:low temperature requirement protein A [Mycobacteriaceae bacterium]